MGSTSTRRAGAEVPHGAVARPGPHSAPLDMRPNTVAVEEKASRRLREAARSRAPGAHAPARPRRMMVERSCERPEAGDQPGQRLQTSTDDYYVYAAERRRCCRRDDPQGDGRGNDNTSAKKSILIRSMGGMGRSHVDEMRTPGSTSPI